jgi:single-stranded DNA-binding protein
MVNNVELSGRLVADAESKVVGKNNTKLTEINLAFSTDNYKNPSGFIRCTAFDGDSDKIAGRKKGETIEVKGTLTFDKWEDATTGQKRSRLGMVITDVLA